MEKINIKINMTKEEYWNKCHKLESYSKIRWGSNIISFLCFILPLPIGAKYALMLPQLLKAPLDIFAIIFCFAITVFMFFISITAAVLFFAVRIMFRNYFFNDDSEEIHYDVIFLSEGFSLTDIETGEKNVIKYCDCTPICFCTYGIGMVYPVIKTMYRVFYFPLSLFTDEEMTQLYFWQKQYLPRKMQEKFDNGGFTWRR